MCKRTGESIDHFLFHCPIAYEMWTMVCYLFGLQWVMPKMAIDMFSAWQGTLGRHRNSFLECCHIASCGVFGGNKMLEVLRDRNGLSLKLRPLFPLFLRTLLDWSVAFHSAPCLTFLDLVEHCNLRDWLYFSLSTPMVYLVCFYPDNIFSLLIKKQFEFYYY